MPPLEFIDMLITYHDKESAESSVKDIYVAIIDTLRSRAFTYFGETRFGLYSRIAVNENSFKI